MREVIYAIVVTIAIVGVGAWLLHSHAVQESEQAAAVAGADLGYGEFVTPLGGSVEGLVTIEGTAVMDTSTGYPAVPYIRYVENDGDTATKQLIFADERGCLPGAGDIPCVPTYPAAAAYPELATGQKIRVSGYIRANRLLITELSREEP